MKLRRARPVEPPKPRRTSSARRDEAELRLLSAAAELIATQGVDGLTLADLAEAAGYSRGLAAHYFGNKNGLLEATAAYAAAHFATRLGAETRSPPGLEALLEVIEAYLTIGPEMRKQALVLQAIIAESLTQPALRHAVAELEARSLGRLADMISAGQRKGEIRSDVDPRRHAVFLLGALRSLVAIWLIDTDDDAFATVRHATVASVRRALQA